MTFHSLCTVITLVKQLFNFFFFFTPLPSFGLEKFNSILFSIAETISWLFKKEKTNQCKTRVTSSPPVHDGLRHERLCLVQVICGHKVIVLRLI